MGSGRETGRTARTAAALACLALTLAAFVVGHGHRDVVVATAQAASTWPHVTATLWSDGLGQRGTLQAYRLTSCSQPPGWPGLDCHTMQKDHEPAFPDSALRLGAGSHPAHVGVRTTKRRPAILVRHVEPDGERIEVIARGRGEPTRAPRRWRLGFRTPELPPEAYLNVRARWRNGIGDRDYAEWGFRIDE